MKKIIKGDLEIIGQFSNTLNINNITDISYILNINDINTLLRLENINTITLTIPENNNVSFKIGTQIKIEQAGDGVVNIEHPNVILNSLNTPTQTTGKHHIIQLIKVDIDEWVLF